MLLAPLKKLICASPSIPVTTIALPSNQPTMNLNGIANGVGIGGSLIDSDSRVVIKTIQEREFEKQRELEEKQGIIEIGGQLEKLISRGALEMHYEINNYEEKEYKNHLFFFQLLLSFYNSFFFE